MFVLTPAEIALIPFVLSFLSGLLANFVSPTSPLGKLIHFVGVNGPEIQAAVTAAEPPKK